MRTKYITSCTRPSRLAALASEPLIWTRSLSLDSIMAYLPASLLPPAHGKIEDKGTERHKMSYVIISCSFNFVRSPYRIWNTYENAFTPAISPHRAYNLPHQLGLCAQTLTKETGQPLRCLAYPRSYLVYSRPARCTACPTVGQSNHSKTTCSNLDYDITTTGNQNPDFEHVAVTYIVPLIKSGTAHHFISYRKSRRRDILLRMWFISRRSTCYSVYHTVAAFHLMASHVTIMHVRSQYSTVQYSTGWQCATIRDMWIYLGYIDFVSYISYCITCMEYQTG